MMNEEIAKRNRKPRKAQVLTSSNSKEVNGEIKISRTKKAPGIKEIKKAVDQMKKKSKEADLESSKQTYENVNGDLNEPEQEDLSIEDSTSIEKTDISSIEKNDSNQQLASKSNEEVQKEASNTVPISMESIAAGLLNLNNLLATRMDKSDETMNQLVSRLDNIEKNINTIDYKGSKLMTGDTAEKCIVDGKTLLISSDLMTRACRSKKISIFASKLFSSLCTVEDIYMKSISGKGRAQSKSSFSSEIEKRLVNLAKQKLPDLTNHEDIVHKIIINKLSNFNSLFQQLKSNAKFSIELVTKCKLGMDDTMNLGNFEQYHKDPKLFEKLDLIKQEELSKFDDNEGKMSDDNGEKKFDDGEVKKLDDGGEKKLINIKKLVPKTSSRKIETKTKEGKKRKINSDDESNDKLLKILLKKFKKSKSCKSIESDDSFEPNASEGPSDDSSVLSED